MPSVIPIPKPFLSRKARFREAFSCHRYSGYRSHTLRAGLHVSLNRAGAGPYSTFHSSWACGR